MSGRRGSGAARPEAPNFEGADPRAPVNPGGLAGRQQEPVSSATPSAPRPPPRLSAQTRTASAETVHRERRRGESTGKDPHKSGFPFPSLL